MRRSVPEDSLAIECHVVRPRQGITANSPQKRPGGWARPEHVRDAHLIAKIVLRDLPYEQAGGLAEAAEAAQALAAVARADCLEQLVRAREAVEHTLGTHARG